MMIARIGRVAPARLAPALATRSMSALEVTLFHNPDCSKSRMTKDLLTSHRPELKLNIREYLKEPPSEAEIRALIDALEVSHVMHVARIEGRRIT